ncbi:MAG: rhamnogalacturonan acetylesterase [Chthoniobacteraceae bacterium]
MKTSLISLCAVAVALLIPAQPTLAAEASNNLTLVTIGDSTVCDYATTNIKRGWGQVLRDSLQPSTKLMNLAVGGRSTKTFLETGNWEKALAAKPDFIFIQFGHNDSHAKGQPESTDAATDFAEYLRRYVKEAREVGATPILVTPPHRLMFSPEGKLTGELKPYADSVKRVAHELNVPVVDLYERSGDAFEPMGDSGVDGITASQTDRTHFTEKGARIIAGIVVAEMARIDPRLKAALK